jgi:hypothetical protein
MIICNHCGNVIEDGLRFCSECGMDTAIPMTQVYPERQNLAYPVPNTISFGETYPQQDVYATRPVVENNTYPSTNNANLAAQGSIPANNLRFVILAIGAAILFFAAGGLLFWLLTKKDTTMPGASYVNESRTTTPASTVQPNAPATASTVSVDKEEAIKALNDWINALNNYDLNRHTSYFTDPLDVYHSRRNVNLGKVQADLDRAFARYSKLYVEISNVSITIDSANATAMTTFNKYWRFENNSAKQWTGSVRQMVWLKKIAGRWFISGLKDL